MSKASRYLGLFSRPMAEAYGIGGKCHVFQKYMYSSNNSGFHIGDVLAKDVVGLVLGRRGLGHVNLCMITCEFSRNDLKIEPEKVELT